MAPQITTSSMMKLVLGRKTCCVAKLLRDLAGIQIGVG